MQDHPTLFTFRTEDAPRKEWLNNGDKARGFNADTASPAGLNKKPSPVPRVANKGGQNPSLQKEDHIV